MTKVTIDRELLEQVASEFEHDNDRYMLGRELRKVLAAPRQPEGDGLEVVAWCIPDKVDRVISAEVKAFNESFGEAYRTAHTEPLCRLSDAQRAIAELQSKLNDPDYPPKYARRLIAELREECKIQRNSLAGARNQLRANRLETERLAVDWLAAVAERDTLRQQLADRDAAIEEWSGTAVQNGMECDRLTAQRDKLAGLLREAINWDTSDELLERIDAALDEVNK